MLILGIDTASTFLGLGLWTNDDLNIKIHEDGGLTHSERLIPRLKALLDEGERDIKDIEKVVVSLGPGSFTGIRIGVATANALGLALEIPVVGVSTLEALAHCVKTFDGLIISTMNAQKQCFYTLFSYFENGKLVRLNKEDVYTKEEIMEFARNYKDVMIIGEGIFLWEDLPNFIRRGEVVSIDPLMLCQLGSIREASSKFVEPVYIRKSQAEVEYEQKHSI